MSDTILGIHSNARSGAIDPTTGKPAESSFTDGHAWLSVTRGGVTKTYGLWPDDHERIQGLGLDNGDGSDIRVGMEDRFRSVASRYYQLTPDQATALKAKLAANVEWGHTNNCSSWASETLTAVTGVRINADEPLSLGIVETPRVLGESIHNLELRDRTSSTEPAATRAPSRSSSSFSDANSVAPAVQEHAALSPVAQALVSDSEREVRQIAERHQLPWDQGMHNTVYAVAHQARADGLTGITHLNVQGGQIRFGQLDGAVFRDGVIDARTAANTLEAESFSGLAVADRATEQQAAARMAALELQPERFHQRA